MVGKRSERSCDREVTTGLLSAGRDFHDFYDFHDLEAVIDLVAVFASLGSVSAFA